MRDAITDLGYRLRQLEYRLKAVELRMDTLNKQVESITDEAKVRNAVHQALDERRQFWEGIPGRVLAGLVGLSAIANVILVVTHAK